MRVTLGALLLAACGATEPLDTAWPSTPPLVCGASAELLDAPPPRDTDLGRIAAVDLQQVSADATVTDDGLAIRAAATFLVGNADGLPVLELAPEPAAAWLDGAPLPLDALRRVAVSNPPRVLLVLDVDLDRCTTHTLEVEHAVPTGWLDDPTGQARLERYPEGAWWSSGLEDDRPGRFLGMWFPSNLLFDTFTLDLTIHSGPGYTLASTGEVEERPDGFFVSWARPLRAHSPLWVLSPDAITHRSELAMIGFDIGDGAFLVQMASFDEADVDDLTPRFFWMETLHQTYGPYLHGHRYVAWIREDRSSSMEFDGGTVTRRSALEHEIVHSWFGRGVSPVADRYGWVDEAVTSWATDLLPYRTAPLDTSFDPILLRIGDDEWAGATLSTETYVMGSSILAAIAHVHGVDAVKEALADFYVRWAGRGYRDTDLEEHLTCWFDDDLVREAFAHRAYGLPAPDGPRPSGWCR